MNKSRLKKQLYSFGCENYIKFVSMGVKSFDFREEKNDERCVGRIWHVEKKKKNCMGYLLSFSMRFK